MLPCTGCGGARFPALNAHQPTPTGNNADAASHLCKKLAGCPVVLSKWIYNVFPYYVLHWMIDEEELPTVRSKLGSPPTPPAYPIMLPCGAVAGVGRVDGGEAWEAPRVAGVGPRLERYRRGRLRMEGRSMGVPSSVMEHPQASLARAYSAESKNFRASCRWAGAGAGRG